MTEYQVVSRRCGGCGHVSEPRATDVARPVEPETAAVKETDAADRGEYSIDTAADVDTAGGAPGAALALRPGSSVRIGPRTQALAVLLTCGHYLPVGRATALLATMSGLRVSTGFTAGIRGRAATALETRFLPHMRALLANAPVFPRR